jgi:hypothetical protein
LENSTGSKDVVTVFIVKPGADEQIENGEQLLSFLCSVFDVCSVCASSSSQLSMIEQGTIALNRI